MGTAATRRRRAEAALCPSRARASSPSRRSSVSGWSSAARGDASNSSPPRPTRKRRSQTQLHDGISLSDREELQRMDESDPSMDESAKEPDGYGCDKKPESQRWEQGECYPDQGGDMDGALQQPPPQRNRLRRRTAPPGVLQGLVTRSALLAAESSSSFDPDAASRAESVGVGPSASCKTAMTQCHSRERLKELMSAPVIDWEEVRKAQQSHREHASTQTVQQEAHSKAFGTDFSAQAPVTAAPAPAAPRRRASFQRRPPGSGRPGMYSKSSMMRMSLDRLDRALGDGLGCGADVMNARTVATVAAHHRATGGPKNRRDLRRHSSWAGTRGHAAAQLRDLENKKDGKSARNASWSNKSADGADATVAAAAAVAKLFSEEEAEAQQEPLAHENSAWDAKVRNTLTLATEVINSSRSQVTSPRSTSPDASCSPGRPAALAGPSPSFVVARHGVARSLAGSLAAMTKTSMSNATAMVSCSSARQTSYPALHASRSPSPPVFPGQSADGGNAASLFKTLIGTSAPPTLQKQPSPASTDLLPKSNGLVLTKPASQKKGLALPRPASDSPTAGSTGLVLARQSQSSTVG